LGRSPAARFAAKPARKRRFAKLQPRETSTKVLIDLGGREPRRV
jgi:hypothetical protein